MPDQQLRLVAGLKDNASPGIRKIASEMKRVRVEPGMAQAQKWMRGFNEDVAKFKRSSLTVAGVISSMGITGLAAAGSIGTLAAAFKGLADRTLDMRELGREVGLTADEINAMNRAGQHFGFDPSEMEGAIKHFAGLMPEFKRGYGELNNILARQPDLIKRLRVEDTKTQIQEIFRFLDTIKNPQDRMVFERGIFGTDGVEKLFKDGSGGFEAQVDRFRQTLAPITEAAAQQAQALRDAVNDFNAAVDNLELKAGPTVYHWLTAGVQALESAVDQVQKRPIEVATGAAAAVGLYARYRAMRADLARGWAAWSKEAAPLEAAAAKQESAAVTLNDAALMLKEAAGELRGRGAAPGAGPGAPGEPEKPGAPGGKSPSLVDLAPRGLFALYQMWSLVDGMPDQLKKAETDGAPADPQTAREADWGDRIRHALGFGTRPGAASLSPFAMVPADAADRLRDRLGPTYDAPDTDGNALHRHDDDLSPLYRAAEQALRSTPAPAAPAKSWWGRIFGDAGDAAKPVLHLVGTLKTAAAQAEADGIKPAAFHPAGLIGPSAGEDPVALLAAGTKIGFLEAFRELQGGVSIDGSSARPGIIPASFGGGGGAGNPALGGGSFGGGSANLSGGDAQGAEADRIRALAKKYGIDPRVAVAVAKSEGLGIAWGSGMDHGTSFGAFQLHVGGGLGDLYQRETGRDPRDQANAADMDDWALRYASKNGWGPWHGAARIGVHGMAGIGGRPVGAADLGAGFNGKGDAVGIATSMLGFGERQSAQALGHIMHAGEWCADFINGVIEKSGGKGSGSAMASSFARWGRAVSADDAKRGDVILENAHGRGINHVGLVEGVDHDKAGRVTGIHMISGNYGHIVRRNLEPFREIEGLRRGNEASNTALQGAAAELRDAASKQRAASLDQRQAARVVARAPDWYKPDRQDLGAAMRKADRETRQAAAVEGGIDAHVHLHDNRTSTRIERRGVVRDARITVRRAPQRTFTV